MLIKDISERIYNHAIKDYKVKINKRMMRLFDEKIINSSDKLGHFKKRYFTGFKHLEIKNRFNDRKLDKNFIIEDNDI